MPHLEREGSIVDGTEHKTGDNKSAAAQRAHALLREHPDMYDEVADAKGPACPSKKRTIVINLPRYVTKDIVIR
ncbi:MAG: hypothetical protein ABSE04_02525 [Candidatus Microgenomates bacterium]|jgi:hypothetical protein